MNEDQIIEQAIQGHASTRDAIRWAMQQEREACANVADIALLGAERSLSERVVRAIRTSGEKPPVKTYAGGKPNYCTPEETPEVTGEVTTEVPCKTDPRAQHGFDRNASHSADRYVCECESWEPVDAVNMSKDRVDETAKGEHEPVAWFIQYEDSHEFVWSKPDGWRVKQALEIQPLYTAPPKKEWVGLTDVNEMVEAELTHYWNGEYELTTGARNHLTDFAQAIEAKLKEKNGG